MPRPRPTHLVRNIYPPHFDGLLETGRNYFYFAWEDSRIPAAWAQAFNRHCDALLVPSAHVRDVVERSGVCVPVGVVPYGVAVSPSDGAPLTPLPLLLPTAKRFRFLHVSTGFPRKACDVLIRAFSREFSSREDVALVIKTLPQYDHLTARHVRRARWTGFGRPTILHIDEDFDVESMRRLYAAASCLVHPARAEGFGLPVAEAMLAKVPVIASACSGHADFCTDDTAVLVPVTLQRSRSPFRVEDAEWAEPDEGALRRAMRDVFERRDAAALERRVEHAAAHVRASFTWPRAATRSIAFMQAVDASRAHPLRVGMVTTWNERCGIAEYSRQLIEATHEAAIEWTILAPHRDDADGLVASPPWRGSGREPAAIRCWRDAWPTDLSGVVTEARRLDLQVVHLQSHLNLWGSAQVDALAALRADCRRVFMTLHSVRGARPDADAVRGLAAITRLFVHTEIDRRRLAGLGLRDNVTMLPQGCPRVGTQAAVDVRRALGITGDPVVGTFGFLRPHKGVLELIASVARLRRRYPRIVLVAATAVYPSADSAAYLAQCQDAVRRHGLDNRCHLVTDFLAPHETATLLQACDVIVLPYRKTIDSSSAALRAALASRRPVVATDVPVFSDLADAVHVVKRATPAALARGITHLLEDEALRSRLVANATARVSADSWEVVGRIYARSLRAAACDWSAFRAPYPVIAR